MPRQRGKRPLPTYLKLVKGVDRKDRVNQHEAVIPDIGMPVPPAHLTPEATEEWERISRDLYDAGLLTRVDRGILAAYCQAYGRWVVAERTLAEMAASLSGGALVIRTKTGSLMQNPLVGTANRAMSDMARYATDLGMTPSSRSRVTARPPATLDGAEDPADRYFSD